MVLDDGFIESFSYYAIFTHSSSRNFTFFTYVDDMIITGDYVSSIADLKKRLQRKFDIKNLGPLSYIIDLEVTSKGYLVSK